MNTHRLHSPPSLLLFVLLLLFALVPVACSDDSSSEGNPSATSTGTGSSGGTNTTAGGTNNGTTAPPVTCTDNDGCGADELCDVSGDEGICRPACSDDTQCLPSQQCGAGGFCEPRSACQDSSACTGQGEVCNACSGRCEVSPNPAGRACVEDLNCFDGEFCDPCRSICRPLGGSCDPCQEDAECGSASDVCLDFEQGGRFCATSCTSVSDCPLGFSCDSVDSVGGLFCLPNSGNCAQPGECSDDDDCPAGERCGVTLACVEGCTEGTCPNGEVCDLGACKPPCQSNDDCPEGAECDPSGLCKIPGGCLTSRDCPEPGTYCDVEAQMCAPGCGDDSDCAGLQVCRNNTCGPRPCDGNYLCAFGQVCNKDTGQCIAAEGPYCDACDAEGENQCGGEPNACLRFQDDEGNDVGDFCGVACDPNDLDACPVGYGCQEIQDENGQVVNNLCLRACDREPI